ncbi:MAG: TauD/TfdA family dioxygenase [Betaproteobacteria bacterium]
MKRSTAALPTAEQKFERIAVKPTGAALGADIPEVDLSLALDSAIVEEIKQAWASHLVLRFRGQRLGDEHLMSFSRIFGELDSVPVPSADNRRQLTPGFVTIISNIIENGKAIGGLGAYEAHWHTDMSYQEQPPLGSLLYSIEIPPSGGNTYFANMYFAYERLPDDVKKRIATYTCRHDSSRNSVGELRRGFDDVRDPRDAPGAVHPIVRTHPVTGRRALYLGRRRNSYIVGLDLVESERVLDSLWEHATSSEFVWSQQWRVGDVILWDNRCTMHRRDAFDNSSRRLMHRTQIKGDRVY